MHVKQKLMYMTLGGLLVLGGNILASVNNDIAAQSGAQDAMFGKITCSELSVVDDKGMRMVGLYSDKDSGTVIAHGKDGGSVLLSNNEHGGSMTIWSNGPRAAGKCWR